MLNIFHFAYFCDILSFKNIYIQYKFIHLNGLGGDIQEKRDLDKLEYYLQSVAVSLALMEEHTVNVAKQNYPITQGGK